MNQLKLNDRTRVGPPWWVGLSLSLVLFLTLSLSSWEKQMKIDGRQWTWHILIHLVHLFGKRDFSLSERRTHQNRRSPLSSLFCFLLIRKMRVQVSLHWKPSRPNHIKLRTYFNDWDSFTSKAFCTSACVCVPERCEEEARLCWLESNFEHIPLFSSIWTQWPWDWAHPRGMIVWASQCCVSSEWHKPHQTFPSGQSLHLSVS